MAFKVFHESRVTETRPFIVCFDRRVVRNAGFGSAVAAVVFFASWGALTMWFLLWGFFLGWIPAAVMATYIGYRCR